jgi:hypothetical protein
VAAPAKPAGNTHLISNVGQQMVETQCVFIDAAKSAGVPHIVNSYTEKAK